MTFVSAPIRHNVDSKFYEHLRSLLTQADCSSEIQAIQTCKQGGNNRTYKILTQDGTYLAKQYFRESEDSRDRLKAEYTFLNYAYPVASHCVPKPYTQNHALALALYSFVTGKPFNDDAIVTPSMVEDAAKFFVALNEPEARAGAHNHPFLNASEACFSIRGHLDLIDRRIERLAAISTQTAEDKEARRLLTRLSKLWHSIRKACLSSAKALNLAVDESLPKAMQCISPSDFGFHNAIKTTDSRLYFIDFEYAGWDDPAKMVGDFFAQLAVPIPSAYFEGFVEQTMQPFSNTTQLIKRAKLLRPIYQVKWCCIALNIFIPINLARRQFANPQLNVALLKKQQLEKAEALLMTIGQ